MAEYTFITIKGGVPALQAELTELGLKPTAGGIDWATSEATEAQLKTVHTRSQTTHRVLQTVAKAANREALQKAASAVATRPGTFCVRASGIDRQELEEEIGGLIKEATNSPVKLEKPDTLYFVHDADGTYILGIDLFGELAKRHYKIITGSHSLAGPFAACTLRIAGWTPKYDLVVWPCATGELAIEAALWASKKSPRAYELKIHDAVEPKCAIIAADAKLPMIRSTEKNSKVAGVMQYIRFSRQDADWLETKHQENGVQYFIGLLPNLALMQKLAKEVYYQLDFILKTKGTAAFLCVNDESSQRLEAAAEAAEYAYDIRREYLWSGKHTYTLIICTKGKKKK
jgi:23S rRNA G2445 N2-methylase RlmL